MSITKLLILISIASFSVAACTPEEEKLISDVAVIVDAVAD